MPLASRNELINPLSGSTRDYLTFESPALTAKAVAFTAWFDARVAKDLIPYSKRLLRAPGARAALRYLNGIVHEGINFSSQDYLSLASHPSIKRAAQRAIGRFGVHSAGSSALAGNMEHADKLEALIAGHLHTPHVTLYPTGWAAGYGAAKGLVRPSDHVVIDSLAHNCLFEGAAAATRNLHLCRHLDVSAARAKLAAIRAKDTRNGILVITESLFSMDSDTPNIAALQAYCAEFNALLLVDVAHDLGCLGPDGTGRLGEQGMLGKVDIVMGSFSKTFASNGGFVATRCREIKEYFRYFSSPNTFSNALSPAQIAIVSEAFRIVRSPEGQTRRDRLFQAILALRSGLQSQGMEVAGAPSPIIPVIIGREDVARTAARYAAEAGVLANLVEYPAVSRNTARFRMQAMSDHDTLQCGEAASILARAITKARQAFVHSSAMGEKVTA